ncbi:putative S-adenosylmethionine-dependent methyltransferase/MSMEI_2290 [Roseibium album]|nr:putative S-adenosylmethionine-dependent methyltransferase/MSMEI_2290 [Roseibium album]
MFEKPKKIDPRKNSVSDFVNRSLPNVASHPNQEQIVKLLSKDRTLRNLAELKDIVDVGSGLGYSADVLAQRAHRRVSTAVNLSMKFGGTLKIDRVLDVGCARAENAVPLADLGGKEYLGLDINSDYFPENSKLGMTSEFLHASAEKIPLEDNSIDFAISFNVFEHIPDVKLALSEVVRVLKPGGIFYTKFGPPFNAAMGPHLNRKINMPYIQHLFTDSVVSEFVSRKDPYMTVNRHPLSYYRTMFFSQEHINLKVYREYLTGFDYWAINAMPELTETYSLDELAVSAIECVIVKDTAMM